MIVAKLNNGYKPERQTEDSHRDSRPERKRMPEDKKGPGDFKVVDRRSFGTDGSRRDAEETPEEKPNPEEEGHSAGVVADQAGPSSVPAPVSFQTLVSYLATTVMFQLGLLAGPSGERIPLDLANARRTLDLLDILQEKTRGNLAPEEAKLLDDVLYELRLSFLEIQKGGPPESA